MFAGSTRAARGYTIVELLVVVTIIGVLMMTSVSTLSGVLPGQRAASAARQLAVDLKNAQAIAARTNTPVQVTFMTNDPECSATQAGGAFGWTITSVDRSTGAPVQLRVAHGCASHYADVTVAPRGPAGGLRCFGEPLNAGIPANSCTMCNGGTFTFFPSGDTTALTGMSVAFVPAPDFINNIGARTRAVGIHPRSGKTRVYAPRIVDNGQTWECP